MSSKVTIAEPNSAKPANPVKERRISKRMQQALIYLATKGVNQREAAKLSGISEFHLSRELKKPQVQAFIARKSRENIQIGVLRASTRVIELIDAVSEHVSLQASTHVLAIEGIKPPESGTNISIINNVSPGYVLDLRDDTRGPLIQHPTQPDAKPLIELDTVHKADT